MRNACAYALMLCCLFHAAAVHANPSAGDPLPQKEAAGDVEREFWAAPSIERLARYGARLRAGRAYEAMLTKLQAGQPARIAGSKGFEAAKRRMRDGVVPSPDSEIQRGAAVPVDEMRFADRLRPRPIKPSLFRSQADVVLASEGGEDAFAAVAGARVALAGSQKPVGWADMHDGPQARGVTGFGDIGAAEVSFTPGVMVYELSEDGLVAGRRLVRRHEYGDEPEHPCASTYTNPAALDAVEPGALDLQPVRSFSRHEPNGVPLMRFTLGPRIPPPYRARIVSRAAEVSEVKASHYVDHEAMRRALRQNPAKVVLHEIDLDGDGVADVLLWEIPSWGELSEGLNIDRAWFLNVGGRWYRAGTMEVNECT